MDSVTSYLHLPIQDPTWVFFLVLLIILFAPLLFAKLRIPHIIGLILAGVLIGEHGFNILERDTSFKLFGQVGIYYIMFLAGLEMDLVRFKQNLSKGFIFGALTSLIPFVFGFITGYYLLHYTMSASLLLACIFASHTIVSYPIVARYGLTKHPAVTITISATMIALLFALLVLALISGQYKGEADTLFWLLFSVKCIGYFVGIIVVFPIIIRWFFKRYTERVVQYIFVIMMVFLAAALANLCGLEGLLGAFIAGLIFNRFIPYTSPLMNRIEFVGNALFIPYFLVGVGMLVNLQPLFKDMNAIMVVLIIVIASTLSKLIASTIARKIFKFNHAQGLLMFGLSEAHAAGAIAMVMVGTSLEISPGVPLMSNAVLDGVVLMILISCIISSMATDQGARKLRLQLESSEETTESRPADDEKMMVLVKDTSKLQNILQTAIMMRNTTLNRGLICLNVVNDADFTEKSQAKSRETLRMAEDICSAADVPIQTQSRLAVNIVNGVVHSMRENDASEILIGIHDQQNSDKSYYGQFANGLIQSMERQLIIVDYTQPVNTIRKIVVAVPERAEYEVGFYRWVCRLARLAGEIGCRIEFRTTESTGQMIHQYIQQNHKNIRADYKMMDTWREFLSLKDEVNPDHLFVVVTARQGGISYHHVFDKIPELLQTHFSHCSVMMIFPDQFGENNEVYSFSAPLVKRYETNRVSAWMSKWISKVG
jgi:Kef-type K+ transport system membrane component KefB